MSADYEDLRAKITVETHAVLSAVSAAKGTDLSELVRGILHDWAAEQITAARHIFGAIDGLEPISAETVGQKPRRVPLGQNLRVAIYERDNGLCVYCGTAVDRGGSWHIDHVTPVSKGGTNEPDNLRLACLTCNLRKSARNVSDFKVA